MALYRALPLALLFATAPASAAVMFQNTGNLTGWDRVYTQRAGTNTEVATPAYRGGSAVRNFQIYQTAGTGNYHSEVVKNNAEREGQDLYFGQAIYLPADWTFHDQNVTFQQWAPDDNSGPWVLMFVQGDHLRVAGVRQSPMGTRDLGPITALRGTWIRVVTRINLATNGAFEVWVNGAKVSSVPGDHTVSGGSIRWSAGIYCTRWDTEAPGGQSTLAIFHDHFRIATTYEEADPATWQDDGSAPPDAAPTDALTADALTADAAPDAAGRADASSDTGTGGTSGTGGAGGRGGTGGAVSTGGTGGDEPSPDASTGRPAPSGGCDCHVDRNSSGGTAITIWILTVAALARRRWRSPLARRRAKRRSY